MALSWPAADHEFQGVVKDGLGFFVYPTTRYKTVTIHAVWVRELEPHERAYGASLVQVMRRGTASMPSRQTMQMRLEDVYGASFRADVGKLGDKQLLSFHVTVVNGRFLPGQPDTVSAALDFLTEVINHPYLEQDTFPALTVAQEKEQVKRQIAAIINDKGQYAMARLIELVADGERFGLRKLGTAEEVDQVTAESLTHFYRDVCSSAPFLFSVVGDVDPDTLWQRFQDRWHGARRPVKPILPYRGHHQQMVREASDVSQAKLNLAFRAGLTAKDADYPALLMYAGILGGFSHSKLFMNVREKASLAYYAYSRVDPALALMVIGAGIESRHYQAARSIIEEQVDDMRQGRFSDEDRVFTVKAYANELLSEEDSPAQLIGRHLERVLVGGGLTGPELIAALRGVSRDDIVRVGQAVELDTVYFLSAEKEGEHGE
jgi:predicted Zn-dependent peptidase